MTTYNLGLVMCLWADDRDFLLRPVLREEVKEAVFDIDEDKAPGPDGFSSSFYKAAWPVIGDEVTRAVQDFFISGKLLKQINSTLLCLIQKRMQGFMAKLVSPSQNAFVPDWIEECITTTSFSVSLNGGLYGYFPGARGLRQGDPISPYLFVLAMEVLQLLLHQLVDQSEGFHYHYQCKEINLINLGFADDLIL
ncbi:UNVERIFIED_CONTAM: putative mitochondrial protein [Sesamum latifolium]|uniref:Mitochondrial protein n=1 Tax=Sesamum latifolium TaxID=2727402 RepID=A0AAW2XPH1_9LAMI